MMTRFAQKPHANAPGALPSPTEDVLKPCAPAALGRRLRAKPGLWRLTPSGYGRANPLQIQFSAYAEGVGNHSPGLPRERLPWAARCVDASTGFLTTLLLLFIAFAAPAARAASQRPFTLEEMVAHADTIVVGRVVRSEARWQGKLIITVSAVQVNESLKGNSASEIEVFQLGGTAVHPVIGAPVTMTASEQTTLASGEDVLLFLQQTKDGARQLVGGAQGKLLLRADPATGELRLQGGPKQLEAEQHGEARAITSRNMTLDAMRQQIRACMEQQNPKGQGSGQGFSEEKVP